MIHESAIAETIVAQTLFRPAFSHSLGHKETSASALGMSALPPKADIDAGILNVRL